MTTALASARSAPRSRGRARRRAGTCQSALPLPLAFCSCLNARTRFSASGESMSATERGRESENGFANFSQPLGATPSRLPRTARKIFALSSPKPGSARRRGEQLAGVGCGDPDRSGVAVVVLDDVGRERVGALRHRTRVAVQRGLVAEHQLEVVGAHGRDLRDVERAAEAVAAASRGRGTPTPSAPAGRAACRAGARTRSDPSSASASASPVTGRTALADWEAIEHEAYRETRWCSTGCTTRVPPRGDDPSVTLPDGSGTSLESRRHRSSTGRP